ncbi:beta-glucosidase C [Rhinocladiella mackenziei CBS 650.93]|uniref:beta-glucosidase n=1 Tax=Rhinocladiella mackenziei CBS 650.93 TaxID=1442369 RepID=A0A0D2JHH9_9EURO|nr:beta-glucosidase C [Rhinocladiella mackenziei CBS 650.93]KIX08810.1 beta-glucosidase C [Rhinocladiella mackenziei CBS 650.93]
METTSQKNVQDKESKRFSTRVAISLVESRPELIINLVEDGHVPGSRINESVRRMLREKFLLGFFDNLFVDVEAANEIVGNPLFVREGEVAQRRSYTVLTNNDDTLPSRLEDVKTKRTYVEGISEAITEAKGLKPVLSPGGVDIAILRLKCPYEPRPGGFEALFHAGGLEFPAKEKTRLAEIFKAVPISIVDMYLDRPGAPTEIADWATALIVNYVSSDNTSLDVAFGDASPEAKLLFDLPRSTPAVEKGREDVPFDTKDPLLRFGHGPRSH